MDLARGYGPKQGTKVNRFHGGEIGLNSNAILIIKLPDSRVLRIMARSLFLAVVLLTLPSIGSIIRGSSDVMYDVDAFMDSDARGFKMLPILFRELADEGLLLKKGQKGLIMSSGNSDMVESLELFDDNEVDLVIDSDMDHQNSIPCGKFDFVIASSTRNTKFVDRVLEAGGIMVTQLRNDLSIELQELTNYRIVYLRRFENTVVAMRKVGYVGDKADSRTKLPVCSSTPEAKKAAVKRLEDVLLEPPRRTLAKLTSRKMKFLPELLCDSLVNYPRRVFISDEKNGVTEWFKRTYPKKNQDFEIYNFDVEIHDQGESENGLPVLGVSEWMSSNLKEEDYVVMKAEAEVVEEMMRKKTICLVDELFLGCRNQWEDDEYKKSRSQRAYWECLTLYGKLRDEGVVVHQWWSWMDTFV